MRHAPRATLLLGLLTLASVACRDRSARASVADVAEAPPPEPSIARDDVIGIHRMLVADDFDGLDARLAWNADSARHDSGYEGRYRAALDVFDAGDPALGPHLDAWVLHNRISSTAHLARATWRIARASSARGGRAGETTKQQLDAMFHWGELAKQDLESAEGADPTNALIYFESMGVAMWYGEPAERKALLDSGLAQLPGSLLLRLRYLHSVRPRWGGAVEQMEAQVREADSAAARYPRLRLLHGFVAYDDASALYDRGDYAGAVRRFTDALRNGDTWQYRAERASAYFHARQYQDASRALARPSG